MLVLSRKTNEGITIETPRGTMHLMVVEIRGDKVKLGFDADDSTLVFRDELYQRIKDSADDGKLAHLRDQLDWEDSQR